VRRPDKGLWVAGCRSGKAFAAALSCRLVSNSPFHSGAGAAC
jgi:hypothetical protein